MFIVTIQYPVQLTHKNTSSIVFVDTSSSKSPVSWEVSKWCHTSRFRGKYVCVKIPLRTASDKAKELSSFCILPYSSRLGKHSIFKQPWKDHHVFCYLSVLFTHLIFFKTHIYVKWSRRRMIVCNCRLEKRRKVCRCQFQDHATSDAALEARWLSVLSALEKTPDQGRWSWGPALRNQWICEGWWLSFWGSQGGDAQHRGRAPSIGPLRETHTSTSPLP